MPLGVATTPQAAGSTAQQDSAQQDLAQQDLGRHVEAERGVAQLGVAQLGAAQQGAAQPLWGRPASPAAEIAPAPGPSTAPPGYHPAFPATVPPPPAEGRWRPGRVEAVPGTGFAVVHPQIAPVTSGLGVGSLIAGIAAILVSFLVLCFGLAGADSTWGPWVAAAFTVLGVLAGAGGIGLGLAARRQIRRSGQPGRIRFTGRGAAVAGIACGATGLGIALLSLVLVLVLYFV